MISGSGTGRTDPQEPHKMPLNCGHHRPAVAAREGALGSCFLPTSPLSLQNWKQRFQEPGRCSRAVRPEGLEELRAFERYSNCFLSNNLWGCLENLLHRFHLCVFGHATLPLQNSDSSSVKQGYWYSPACIYHGGCDNLIIQYL